LLLFRRLLFFRLPARLASRLESSASTATLFLDLLGRSLEVWHRFFQQCRLSFPTAWSASRFRQSPLAGIDLHAQAGCGFVIKSYGFVGRKLSVRYNGWESVAAGENRCILEHTWSLHSVLSNPRRGAILSSTFGSVTRTWVKPALPTRDLFSMMISFLYSLGVVPRQSAQLTSRQRRLEHFRLRPLFLPLPDTAPTTLCRLATIRSLLVCPRPSCDFFGPGFSPDFLLSATSSRSNLFSFHPSAADRQPPALGFQNVPDVTEQCVREALQSRFLPTPGFAISTDCFWCSSPESASRGEFLHRAPRSGVEL